MLDRLKRIIGWPYDIYKDAQEHRRLVVEHGDLEVKLGSVDEIKERVSDLSLGIENLRVTRAEMMENARANNLANKALEEWKMTERDPLKKRIEYLEKEFEGVVGESFSLVVNTLMESAPRIQKVPFIYYDLNSRELIYTRGALRFLGIESGPEKQSMGDMLDYIKEEDRRGVVRVLKNGERLRRYKASTVDGKELMLSIYTFDYQGKTLGVGISLYDSGVKDLLMRVQFVRQLRKATSAFVKGLDEARYRAKELVDKPGLANLKYDL